jgi:hypothetical protein
MLMATLLDFGKKEEIRIKTKKFLTLDIWDDLDELFECEREFWIETRVLNPKAPIKKRKVGFAVMEKRVLKNLKDGSEDEFVFENHTFENKKSATDFIYFWKGFCDKLSEKRKIFDGRYFWDYKIEEGKIILLNKNWVM